MHSRKKGPCAHTTCLILRAEDGGSLYGRCLVCGKIGPSRSSSKAAREALVEYPERDTRDDGDSRYGNPSQIAEPLLGGTRLWDSCPPGRVNSTVARGAVTLAHPGSAG